MSERLHTATDMAAAELIIRDALSASSPGARLDAIMLRYWHIETAQRDALFAVLAARVTLVAPSLSSSAVGAI